MPEVKREDLIKAAKELNDVLGLDPQIKTGKKVTDKELTEQILEAADLLLPEDDISEETMKVIKLLQGESVEEEDDDEVEEEEELEEDTEVEELEEVEEDEDFETEEEEVKDEVDEKKTKSKTKKVEKEQKKDMKSNKQKKENVSKNDRSKSNKAIVYEAWKSNITDVKELAARVNNRVKETTIRTWISQWKKGKNLPAIAKKGR